MLVVLHRLGTSNIWGALDWSFDMSFLFGGVDKPDICNLFQGDKHYYVCVAACWKKVVGQYQKNHPGGSFLLRM